MYTPDSGIGLLSVSHEVERDHRELGILYKGLMQAVVEEDPQTASKLQTRFSWELARYLVALQLVLSPGTGRSRADQGNGDAQARGRDLAAIRDGLLHFIRLRPEQPDFGRSAEELGSMLQQHVKKTERRDLVAVEQSLDTGESERMARDWERTGGFLPSEGIPDPPPFKTVDTLLKASLPELQRAWGALPRARRRCSFRAS